MFGNCSHISLDGLLEIYHFILFFLLSFLVFQLYHTNILSIWMASIFPYPFSDLMYWHAFFKFHLRFYRVHSQWQLFLPNVIQCSTNFRKYLTLPGKVEEIHIFRVHASDSHPSEIVTVKKIAKRLNALKKWGFLCSVGNFFADICTRQLRKVLFLDFANSLFVHKDCKYGNTFWLSSLIGLWI